VLHQLWCVDLGLLSDAHPAFLSHPSSAAQREKIRWKSLWVDIKTGGSLTNYCGGQNRLNLGKMQIKTTPPFLLPFFPGLSSLLPSKVLYLSHRPRAAQGDGEWDLWSGHNNYFLPLLTLFPRSQTGSLPGDTVLRQLLQHGSFPGVAVLGDRAGATGQPLLGSLEHLLCCLVLLSPQHLQGRCSHACPHASLPQP